MAVTPGGYDPSKIGTGGIYGTTTPRRRPTTATTATPGGYNPTIAALPADQRYDRGDMYSSGDPLPPGFRLDGDYGPPPAGSTPGGSGPGGNVNPFGGVKQVDWNSLYGLIGAGKPQAYQYQNLDLPEYNAPDFYEWDPSQFDIARRAVTDQIGAGRTGGNRTYDEALTELNQYQNPFGNVRTTNPGVRDAMARMMQANGIDPDINAQVDWEGQQADDAFGYTQALLAGTADQRQDSNLRALGGDRRRFNEGLDSEQRMLGTSIDLAMARARSQYDRDLFAYGKEEADKRYEIAVQEAVANNQGANSVSQANTAAQNDWRQGVMSPLIELLLGGDGAGVDIDKLLAAIGG